MSKCQHTDNFMPPCNYPPAIEIDGRQYCVVHGVFQMSHFHFQTMALIGDEKQREFAWKHLSGRIIPHNDLPYWCEPEDDPRYPDMGVKRWAIKQNGLTIGYGVFEHEAHLLANALNAYVLLVRAVPREAK